MEVHNIVSFSYRGSNIPYNALRKLANLWKFTTLCPLATEEAIYHIIMHYENLPMQYTVISKVVKNENFR